MSTYTNLDPAQKRLVNSLAHRAGLGTLGKGNGTIDGAVSLLASVYDADEVTGLLDSVRGKAKAEVVAALNGGKTKKAKAAPKASTKARRTSKAKKAARKTAVQHNSAKTHVWVTKAGDVMDVSQARFDWLMANTNPENVHPHSGPKAAPKKATKVVVAAPKQDVLASIQDRLDTLIREVIEMQA